jgi:2-keto-4-pentenoate hydratase/2-oxohepta-3-ene-1,7-dioic acid hydratase in catechol pathway
VKLLFFNDFRLGVVRGDEVIDVGAAVKQLPHVGPADLINAVIAGFEDVRGDLESAARDGEGVPLSSVRIRPPLPRPTTIACMAVNYMEDGMRDEPAPINGFLKSPSAIIGDGDTMVLPDVPASIFEGEAELALVIGRRASQVTEAEAMDYVFGYTNFIDGSARGLHPGFYQMKSRDTFAPIGPYLVTADEIADPQHLQIQLSNNGELKQNFNTDDMAHQIARSIEFITSIHTLEPGDILATGTNHGGLNPFQDGDEIELETEGLGRLHISVSDALGRSWERSTRLAMAERGEAGTPPQLSGTYTPTG